MLALSPFFKLHHSEKVVLLGITIWSLNRVIVVHFLYETRRLCVRHTYVHFLTQTTPFNIFIS